MVGVFSTATRGLHTPSLDSCLHLASRSCLTPASHLGLLVPGVLSSLARPPFLSYYARPQRLVLRSPGVFHQACSQYLVLSCSPPVSYLVWSRLPPAFFLVSLASGVLSCLVSLTSSSWSFSFKQRLRHMLVLYEGYLYCRRGDDGHYAPTPNRFTSS